jgi:outer membrane protein
MIRIGLFAAAAALWTCAVSGDAVGQTLDEVLAQAYASNPRLQAARARLRSTDEGVATAMSGWRPTVTFSGNAGEGWRDAQGQAAFGNQRSHVEPRGASVNVAQNLYRGGRTTAAIRQADFLVQSDRSNLLDTEQQVLLQAVTAYTDVVRDQATLELNQNNEKVLDEQLEATRTRARVGELTGTDVAQAESRLALARASRVAAEVSLSSSRAAYEQIIGVAPGTLVAPPPVEGLPANLDEARAVAGERSFPVMAAYFAERAARENVDVVFGEALPLVTLNGTAADNREVSTTSDRTKSATLSLQVTVPLYEGGSVAARTRAAKETAAQRRKEYDQQVRSAVQMATQAWKTLDGALAQVRAYESQIRAAQLALDGVRQEARLGTRTTLDVLDAEQELLNSRVNLVRAQHDVVVQTYTVRSAVGTGTAMQLKLPVTLYDYEQHYDETRNKWVGFSTDEEESP